MTWHGLRRNYEKLLITWMMALRAAAAITWRSLVANLAIVLTAIAVSLALGLEIGVRPSGVANLSFQWTRPFGAYVAIGQIGASVWAVKRAVEIVLLPVHRLSLTAAISATWSFAWRHFVAVFGVATLLYGSIYFFGHGRFESLKTPVLVLIAVWSFAPSFVWAVRGMLRVQHERLRAL